MYVYVWTKYPSVVGFLDHAFLYQVPVLLAHAWFSLVASLKSAGSSSYDDDEFEIEGYDTPPEMLVVNPGSGKAMAGGMEGVDPDGNAYGFSSDD
jgi:hypothetical protein